MMKRIKCVILALVVVDCFDLIPKRGEDYFYMLDELGSGMYLTGTDGASVSTYAYDEFGRNIDPFTGKKQKPSYTKQGNIIQPLAFTGYQNDEMTDNYFAQARYYNSEAGRFVSEDKVRGYKAKSETINRYLYCWNSPMGYIDCNGKYGIKASVSCATPMTSTFFVDIPTPGEVYTYTGYENYEAECSEREDTRISLEEMQSIPKEGLPDYTEEIDKWLFGEQKEIDAAFDKSYSYGSWVFFDKVRGGHEMDIKDPENWDKAFDIPFLGENNYFLYHGVVMNASTLGNVTYGYVGANHFSDYALYTGGAAVQLLNRHDWIHIPMMHMLPYYGDMPEDHEAIKLGIKWGKEGFCDE